MLLSQVGYVCISFIRQHLAKEAMEQQLLAAIPESSLQVFDAEANKHDIIWEEQGKEFLLHGKMYDVAKTKIINGKTYLYCLGDNKEDQVLRERSNAVRSGLDQNPGNQYNGHTVKFQLSDCTVTGIDQFSVNTNTVSQIHPDLIVAIVSGHKKINTPPPIFIQCSQNQIL